MPTMSFHEVRFPEDISFASRGGPKFDVNVIMTKRGNEIRTTRQANPRRQYDVKYGIRTREQLMAVKRFFLARKGSLHGFRYKDWLDFTTAPDHRSPPGRADHPLFDLGDGTFQLQKLYESGGYYHRRRIFKPVRGTVQISDGGGPALVEDVDYVVDYTTGVVTFLTVVENPMGGCEFDVPVHFDAETDKWLPTIREDYDIGAIQSITLKEIKLLLNPNPITDIGEYPGPGPGGAGGTVTGGGGGDPDPDYSDPDPNIPDPPPDPNAPPDPETYDCKECGDCCFSDNSTFTVTSEWPVMGYTELADDLTKDWVDAYNAVRTSVPPLPFLSADIVSVNWRWTAPAVTGSRTGESIAPYFQARYLCTLKYWELSVFVGGAVSSVQPIAIETAQAGSTCTSANYEVESWLLSGSGLPNRTLVTEPDVEGHLTNQWCEKSEGSCVKLS